MHRHRRQPGRPVEPAERLRLRVSTTATDPDLVRAQAYWDEQWAILGAAARRAAAPGRRPGRCAARLERVGGRPCAGAMTATPPPPTRSTRWHPRCRSTRYEHTTRPADPADHARLGARPVGRGGAPATRAHRGRQPAPSSASSAPRRGRPISRSSPALIILACADVASPDMFGHYARIEDEAPTWPVTEHLRAGGRGTGLPGQHVRFRPRPADGAAQQRNEFGIKENDVPASLRAQQARRPARPLGDSIAEPPPSQLGLGRGGAPRRSRPASAR